MHGDALQQYRELKAQFTNGTFTGDRLELKTKLDALRDEIALWVHPGQVIQGFDWRVEFAEAWSDNDGFDMVLANPPYINMVEMDSTDSAYRACVEDKVSDRDRWFRHFRAVHRAGRASP
jgi:hypothetical protein